MELNSMDVQTFCELQGGITVEQQYFLNRLYKGQSKSFWDWHESVQTDVELSEPKFPKQAKKGNNTQNQ